MPKQTDYKKIAGLMTPIFLQGIPDNIRKFLMLITFTEGTDHQKTPYNELFGYENFSDMTKHPNKKVKAGKYISTAAGRYQILYGTYKMLKMKDMTPASQDAAAINLIKNCNAYNNIVAGQMEVAIRKCNKIWASLPESPYGQPTYKMIDAISFLNAID